MTAQESDLGKGIISYQIEMHRELRRIRAIRHEKKIKAAYESAKRTLQTLGLNPNLLPEPTMDRYAKYNNPTDILHSLTGNKDLQSHLSAGEKTNKIYEDICKKAIPRTHKALISAILAKQAQHRKISTVCQRELKRALGKTSKTNPILKGKRVTKELQLFFRRSQRTIREKKKREEKEDYERRKKEEEEKEEEKQAKKLNFLITQTELFTHFILGKKTNLSAADEQSKIVLKAAEKHKKSLKEFDGHAQALTTPANEEATDKTDKELPMYNNSILPISESVKIPSILKCTLKDYQKRGLEWLVTLYDQGINGMLADEMGLGKTVQAISFLAHMAENEGKWGPFLVITPASTLHNWEQELSRFVPAFKIVSYWGSVADRKALRKNWQQRKLQMKESPFHVVITSYQLAVTDEKYFGKIKWQYMVLDEAQAIKSSTSTRWKTLLSFKARSRLLLTGTPIQNTLQELWALLHFIMPTLFDSHGEFSEWFKIQDGESVNEAARLRMVLQPFMLRREKKDVADELGKKIEKTIICELSPKQRNLYERIKRRTPMASFLDAGLPDDIEGIEGLMNLVMQFRKVCNHPDLFEKQEVCTGWAPPPSRVYMPQAVVEMTFADSCKRSAANVFIQQGSSKNDRKMSSLSKRLCFVEEKRKKMRIDSKINGSIVKLLEKAYIPRCMSAEKKVFSCASVSEPARAPEKVLMSAPGKKVHIPFIGRFVSDSGKLAVLDKLLPKLKEEGHRVLMYFQMTKMIDLFEEYLTIRNYSYLRLDGASKIANRKELVKDWQSNVNRFIFLLSTRAGGLGINLTAADTVIFYDSDWNPTADQQAMDRAHRLGQTKQVTVYRLITAGTIEERIMERAGVKGEIQRMVINTRD